MCRGFRHLTGRQFCLWNPEIQLISRTQARDPGVPAVELDRRARPWPETEGRLHGTVGAQQVHGGAVGTVQKHPGVKFRPLPAVLVLARIDAGRRSRRSDDAL